MIDRLSCKKVIGVKQSKKAIQNGHGKSLYIANNADNKITKSLIELAQKNNVEIIYVDTMTILGKMCDIEVGSAAALLLK